MAKNGSETVSISLESDLISTLDHCCYVRDINRSQAAREAVKLWIAVQIQRDPAFWERVYFGVNNKSKQKKIF